MRRPTVAIRWRPADQAAQSGGDHSLTARRPARRFAALNNPPSVLVVAESWRTREGTDCLSWQSHTRRGGRTGRRRQ
jgi:hypothetical protein